MYIYILFPIFIYKHIFENTFAATGTILARPSSCFERELKELQERLRADVLKTIVPTRSTRKGKNRFACAHGSPCWSFTSQPVPPRYRNLADEFSRDVAHGFSRLCAFYKVWLPVFHSSKHVFASSFSPLSSPRLFLPRISFFNKHDLSRLKFPLSQGTFPRWISTAKLFFFFF